MDDLEGFAKVSVAGSNPVVRSRNTLVGALPTDLGLLLEGIVWRGRRPPVR
jgi:hypothetical protein